MAQSRLFQSYLDTCQPLLSQSQAAMPHLTLLIQGEAESFK